MNKLLISLALVLCLSCIISPTKADDSVSFVSFFSISPDRGTDIWGFVDPNTGKEFILFGTLLNGLRIFDVADPANPVLVSHLKNVPGFDVKVWQHYAYTVTGGGGGFGAVIDISNPTSPVAVGSFLSAHNIFISDSGYMFLSSPGIRIMDLNENPTEPLEIWRGGTEGHDATVVEDRLYDFHARSGTFIYDISSISQPTLLGSITDQAISFHHSGWPTVDGSYLFITDEDSRNPFPDITIWDISDPGNPQRAGEWGDSNATVHNLYIIGNYAFISYYNSGFRVLDISDPTSPTVFYEYDTTPLSGSGFNGAFGVYPFAPSNNIYVSDENGLFIFKFNKTTDVPVQTADIPSKYVLEQNYPNPFNSETQIKYYLAEPSNVSLVVFNLLGKSVRKLVDSFRPAGSYSISWDGLDDNGSEVGTGYFIYKLTTNGFVDARKMVLIK